MSITEGAPEGNPTLDSVLADVQAEVAAGDTPNTETEGAPVEGEVASGTDDQPRYTVSVDGQDVEVTLDDLTKGYLRQSDYTKKTQALAQERERYQHFDALDRAFNEDPINTMRDLSKALGITPEQLFGEITKVADNGLDPDDPIAQQLAEINKWRADVDQREQQRAIAEQQAAVDRELEAVKVKFNAPNLDEAALLQFALDNRIPSLEIAYEVMDARATKSAPKPDTKLDTKRKAPKVESGKNRSVGVVPGASDKMTLSEALNAAIAERNR